MSRRIFSVFHHRTLLSFSISALIVLSIFLSAYTRVVAAERTETIPSQSYVTWTTLNTHNEMSNGETHVIRNGNALTLIDVTPDIESLLIYLKERKLTDIDRVIISHLHKDHFGGLYRLPEAGINVKEVIFNNVDDEHIHRDCCSSEDEVGEFFAFFVAHPEIKLTQITSNQSFQISSDVNLQTVYASSADLGGDLHDSNIVLRLDYPNGCVLFTGDIDKKIGSELVKRGYQVQCSILKAPHHGLGAMPDEEFFNYVGAKQLVVPVSYTFWQKDRSDSPIKNYIAESGAAYHITGRDGTYGTLLN